MTDEIRVLLIDDQPIIGEAIGRIITREGDIKFKYCSDPMQALLAAKEFKPTVILQDLIMPNVEGLLLIQFLRAKDSPTYNIPLVVLSSKEEPEIKARAFALGANDYLVKIPAAAELLARVKYHSAAYINNMRRLEVEAILAKENIRMRKELDMLKEMQRLILPTVDELDLIQELDMAGYMEPADEVGGDYYDILYNDGIVTIAIGDVTGHGLESGILMVMTQTCVRTIQEFKNVGFHEFLITLNRTLYKNLLRMDSQKNLTLVLLNYFQGEISISGQHEEILVVRNGGHIERISTMDLGMPIGLDEHIADFIDTHIITLEDGEGIVLYTDGITEARNMGNEQYGISRLCEKVQECWHLSSNEIKDEVIEDLKLFIGQQKVFDDITLLVIKKKSTTQLNKSNEIIEVKAFSSPKEFYIDSDNSTEHAEIVNDVENLINSTEHTEIVNDVENLINSTEHTEIVDDVENLINSTEHTEIVDDVENLINSTEHTEIVDDVENLINSTEHTEIVDDVENLINSTETADEEDSLVSEEHFCKVYGNYQKEYFDVVESLDIDFGLKEATRKKRWTNNYKVVEFLSDYFSTFLEVDNDRKTDFRHNIKYIVNELLENAIKFNSHKDYEIKLKLNLVNETIFINICNSTPVISLPRLESLINDILTEDTMELYIKRIEESLGEETGSGLGLLTIINDYGAELSWKIESLDKNNLLLIDTMVKLNI